MLYRAATGEAEETPTAGVMVLGFDAFGEVPVTDIDLASGDVLLAYTDGLTERFSLDGDIYGEARLLEVLKSSGAGAPERLREAVVADLNRFANGRPADDDQAFIALKII
jgi:sigma-B regulation protein RsbU (phosphoserine phosphatase)